MFQIVLYYQKKVTTGEKSSIEDFIKSKDVDTTSISQSDMNNLLDEYSNVKSNTYREEIVDTYVLIYEDENFISEVEKIEQTNGFISWKDESLKVIKNSLS